MVLRYMFATKDSLAFHSSSSVYIIYFTPQEKSWNEDNFLEFVMSPTSSLEFHEEEKQTQLTTPRGVRRGHHSHFERRGMCGGAKAGGEQKLILRDPGLLGGCQGLME